MNTEMAAEAARTREPLSGPRILRCALSLIDRDGLEALSMRRLAGELGVSAMSLYNHVPSKDALLEGITELLMGEIDLTTVEASGDWVDALKTGFGSFRRALLAHPNAVSLIEDKPAVTPAAMRPVEASLAVLRRAGFDAEGAMKAHWLLVGYTMGHVNFQCTNPLHESHSSEEELAARRHALPPAEFPNLHEALPFASSDFEEAYEFGLDVIISGLIQLLDQARPIQGLEATT